MPEALLASSHQEANGVGEGSKLLINCGMEFDNSRVGKTAVLRREHGVVNADTSAAVTSDIRGLAQADGFASGNLIVCAGTTVHLYSGVSWSALAGTLPGSDRVQWTFSELEAAVLAGGRIFISSDGAQLRDADDGLASAPGLAIGTANAAHVGYSSFTYRVDGGFYSESATEIEPGTDSVPVNRWGAIALDINDDDVVSVAVSPANADGYATALEAVADLPDVDRRKIRLGTVAVSRTSGPFVFGTTGLGDADTTVEFTDGEVKPTGIRDLLSAHSDAQITSIASLNQRLLFTYGSRFAFTDALNFGETSAISYYTAEQFPDGIVAGVVHGQYYVLLGTSSVEFWAGQASDTNPFYPVQGASLKFGCLARDTIVALDEALVFVDQHFNVRVIIEGIDQDPPSEPWLSRKIEDADPLTLQAMGEARDGDLFYILRSPDWCYRFSVRTRTWRKLKTFDSDSWRWGFSQSMDGEIYRGAADGSGLGRVDRAVFTDLGEAITAVFSGHLPDELRGAALGCIYLDGVTGTGKATGQGSSPLVEMSISRDGGNTWGPWRSRSMGEMGQYGSRMRWHQNGRSEGRPLLVRFRSSDPVNIALHGLEYRRRG